MRHPIGLALGALLIACPALAQQQESLGEQAIRGLLGGNQAAGQQEEEQVRQLLQQRGYSNVGPVQRMYRTTAERDGREVTVTVDPQTGRVIADRGEARDERPARRTGMLRSESDVRDLLNDQGYTRVTNVRRDGTDIRARAERDGQQVSVVIDAETGWIEEVD